MVEEKEFQSQVKKRCISSVCLLNCLKNSSNIFEHDFLLSRKCRKNERTSSNLRNAISINNTNWKFHPINYIHENAILNEQWRM